MNSSDIVFLMLRSFNEQCAVYSSVGITLRFSGRKLFKVKIPSIYRVAALSGKNDLKYLFKSKSTDHIKPCFLQKYVIRS